MPARVVLLFAKIDLTLSDVLKREIDTPMLSVDELPATRRLWAGEPDSGDLGRAFSAVTSPPSRGGWSQHLTTAAVSGPASHCCRT